MCSVPDPGQGKGWNVVFKAFRCYQGFSGLAVGMRSLQNVLSMPQESVIRNKHNGL